MYLRPRILAFLLLATSCGGALGAGPSVPSIRVAGNQLVDGAGKPVQLRGASMSGLESVAVQGWSAGNPWGAQARPDFAAMREWGMNVLRIPLNSASWLGQRCVDDSGNARDADPGRNYRSTLAAAVKEAGRQGFYVILDLHWNAPADKCPFTQNPWPDSDNAVAFWKSLAAEYGQDPGVMLELYNEPFEDYADRTRSSTPWVQLRDGGTVNGWMSGGQRGRMELRWRSAGLQQLLDTVRAAGARNVVLASGLFWSKDLSAWPQYHPVDPLRQLGAVWHAYAKSSNPGDPESTMPDFGMVAYQWVEAVLASGFPVVITEFGDHNAPGTRGAPFASQLLPWADKHGLSYLGWTWNAWPLPDHVLLKDDKGTPTDGYGQYYREHLQCRAAHAEATCP